ncbi:hypothetical protein [Aquisalimonas sp.]|uniref:hypothetical protein n=1 Tax=Aquisalimonas sp. TaxID=1872621 RepID=UPI0025BC7F5C|nr:hypothetical protein [Aquisalimonas sp.]
MPGTPCTFNLPSDRCVAACAGLMLVLLSLAPASAGATTTEQWQELRLGVDRGARQAQLWTWGWGLFHGAGLTRNAYLASESSDPDTRFDARVDGVKSLLALGALLIDPLPHAKARARVQALSARQNEHADAWERARGALREAASVEHRRRQPRALFSSAVVNVSAGAIIAFGDNRPADGALNAALGMTVSAIQAWSQPTVLTDLAQRHGTAAVIIGGEPVHLHYAFSLGPHHAIADVRW